jgi:hypothetical protein
MTDYLVQVYAADAQQVGAENQNVTVTTNEEGIRTFSLGQKTSCSTSWLVT